ncbi:MAG: tellurite resistance TerB family protein [Pseudomonadota bacterium]|nr:tellurite resistance TerB family protein [Pseudomonadota bacterium]
MSLLNPVDSLIYSMTLSAAIDGTISEKELKSINFFVNTLPVFKNFDRDSLPKKMNECMQLIEAEESFENILDAINSNLEKELKRTAFILSIEIMMTEMNIDEEAVRFLDIFGNILELSELEKAASKFLISAKYSEANK